MIVEPVFSVRPTVDVIISRGGFYTEEQRRVIDIGSETVPFTVAGKDRRVFVSEEFGQRLPARERRFSFSESESVNGFIEGFLELICFEMFADILPRGEEAVSVSVEVGSELSDLTGLSRELQ